jgi:peptidoglycan/xylan/chitin deacetylase (PgdA/CDA1 family)
VNRRETRSTAVLLISCLLLLTSCGAAQKPRLKADKAVIKTGEIRAGKANEYRLHARTGHVLVIDVASPDSGLHLTVEGIDDSAYLVGPDARASRWAGIVAVTQDYIVRLTGNREDSEYTMVAALLPPDARASVPQSHFAGVYHMAAPEANAMHQVTLFMNPNRSAILIGLSGVEPLTPFVMEGTWGANGNEATVELVKQDGEPFVSPEIMEIERHDGILRVNGQEATGWRTAGLQFAPAFGDYHSMVRELHKRLTAAGFLLYANPGPGDDIFGQETQRAVMAFQGAYGLVAHGTADAATWAALDIALLPERTATGQPIVYLTFDDGPDQRYTPQILDLLDRYNAQATFFVLGEQVAYYPDLIRAEVEGGHYVANHGFAHHSFDGMNRAELVREIRRTEKILREAAGDLFAWHGDVRFLRPPYGLTDSQTQEYAAESGYVMVMWDVDSQDWQRPGAAQIAFNVINQAQPGDIVLLHDSGGDRSQTVVALELILQQLGAQGYRFESIFGQ